MFAPASLRRKPRIGVVAATLLLAGAVWLVGISDAEASNYVCKKPIAGTESVHVAFDDHYRCVEPITDEWLASHPAAVEQLEEQYQLWRMGRTHDLRDRADAAQFIEEHPIDFTRRRISLSNGDAQSLAPTFSGEPVVVDGMFQRFFVDRAAARMFLTTDDAGLVSVDMSERFDFEVEGEIDVAGGEDFFVIDEDTAVVEEPNDAGNARDLVVLDISDRESPREIRRLRGALPEVGNSQMNPSRIPDRPPTFAEYRAIRQGHFRPRECGASPSVGTYFNQHCRPDGQCFLLERHRSPDSDAVCEREAIRRHITGSRAAPTTPRRPRSRTRGRAGEPRPRPSRSAQPMLDSDDAASVGTLGLSGSGRSADVAEMAEAEAAPAPEAPASDSAPEGGDGGAGSLSQMMVIDSTLFVLTADAGEDIGWLASFDIGNARRPVPKQIVGLDNGPEALQGHDELLLVAGRDALISASAAAGDGARLLGERRQRCPVNYDPVVMEGSVAYRTIIVDNPRNRCNSRLEVIDLEQPHNPQVLTTKDIDRPRGLAVLDDRLFVADERRGVRVFDISAPARPKIADTWELSGVKDLVLSDFDLYALTDDEVSVYHVAPLFIDRIGMREALSRVDEQPVVVRGD